MVELDQLGRVQSTNRAAQQLFDFESNDTKAFTSLQLSSLEGDSLEWGNLVSNLSLLPKLVRCSCLSSPKNILTLSINTFLSHNQPAYFLVLSPIADDGKETETYRIAEEKFHKVFHLSPDAISITRMSDGLFLEVNQGFIQLTGYQRDELIGNTVLDIGLWCVPQERDKLTHDLSNKGASFMEAKYRIKGGELADGQINARIISINGEDCLVSIVRDLRQQKTIEQALRTSEEQLKIVNRATNDAIWDWSLIDNTLTWNDGMERIFGYNPDQVDPTVQWWEKHIHPEDQQRVVDRINHFIQQKHNNWFDKYRFLRSDGSYAYVYDKGSFFQDENNQIVRMVGGMVDISDRVLAEESLLIRNRQIAEYSFFNSHKIRAPLS